MIEIMEGKEIGKGAGIKVVREMIGTSLVEKIGIVTEEDVKRLETNIFGTGQHFVSGHIVVAVGIAIMIGLTMRNDIVVRVMRITYIIYTNKDALEKEHFSLEGEPKKKNSRKRNYIAQKSKP